MLSKDFPRSCKEITRNLKGPTRKSQGSIATHLAVNVLPFLHFGPTVIGLTLLRFPCHCST